MKDEYKIYLIFEDRNYVHVLCSKNIELTDLPRHCPANLERESQPGAMDDMNMSKITRMQHSFRWQPHLPFMPVNLASHDFMKQYDFKYDMLPLICNGERSWTLDPNVAKSWFSHVQTFHEILSHWRNHLATASMSVNYLPSLTDRDIWQSFDTEKIARGYFWYYCTLIFSMYTKFSFTITGRPNW